MDQDAAVNFFTRAFDPNPQSRLKAAVALEHPCLVKYVQSMCYDRNQAPCAGESKASCAGESRATCDSDTPAVRHKQRLGPIRLGKRGFRLIRHVATDTFRTIRHPVAALRKHTSIPDLELYFVEYNSGSAEALSTPGELSPQERAAWSDAAGLGSFQARTV